MEQIVQRLKEKRLRDDPVTNAAMQAMIDSMEYQDAPMVGSFWYDIEGDDLFGVSSVPAESMKFYQSPEWETLVRTGPKLHSSIWKKEYHRGRDKRFLGDYTQVPRGRVFEFKDQGFIVFTGDWIDQYPQVKSYILDEFQLPASNTVFKKDIHWDLGHGWSNEF